jgi:Predicted AAA-ATPase/PD-(D/E)XK nuclease superfamily
MVRIPYGESNFKEVIFGNYYYIDRTNYIQELENNASNFVFYLRPRRFGKSLIVSMLHHYYGMEHQANFERLFGRLAIGKNPTEKANKFMVLRFEFSRISTINAEKTFEGFLDNTRHGIALFLKVYEKHFTEQQIADILHQDSPVRMLKELFTAHKINEIAHPIYVLIDEYDHFANELISFNFPLFLQMVGRNGFVRKFYETIKTATGDGIVKGLFVTGVSPITLDSMTSGFNIANNLTLENRFHQMMGFEEKEVKELLRLIGVPKNKLTIVIEDMRSWYNGYLFHPEAKNRVYNPDMVMYFANKYQSSGKYPDRLMDINIASDYGKIRNLFNIQGREEENVEVLRTFMESGSVTSDVVTQFSFERPFEPRDLVSLLFYMGFLTIGKGVLSAYEFRFPNFVIEQLYAEYFISIVQRHNNLPIQNEPINRAIRDLATTGNPQPLFDHVKLILTTLSTRDAQRFHEGSLKAIFVSLLFHQQFYYIHSEFESERGYVDVFLEAIRTYKPNYEVAFELKYLKKGSDDNIEKHLDEAEIQLNNYMVSKKFYKRKSIKGFVVAVKGSDIFWREHKGFAPIEA